MKFLLGKSDRISEPVFRMIKYLLSVLSIVSGIIFSMKSPILSFM